MTGTLSVFVLHEKSIGIVGIVPFVVLECGELLVFTVTFVAIFLEATGSLLILGTLIVSEPLSSSANCVGLVWKKPHWSYRWLLVGVAPLIPSIARVVLTQGGYLAFWLCFCVFHLFFVFCIGLGYPSWFGLYPPSYHQLFVDLNSRSPEEGFL